MAFKIAAFSDDLSSVFTEAAELGARAGLQGLAVRNVEGRPVTSLTEDEVRQVGRAAADAGLAISCIGSQFGRNHYLDHEDSPRQAAALLQDAINCAEILETRYVRIFAPWLHGQDPLDTWAVRPDLGRCLDRLAEWLAPAVSLAEQSGTTLMVELEGASYVGQVEEARQLINILDSPAVALCWDVCNGWWSGEDPLIQGWPSARGLPIVDVQAKDARHQPHDTFRPMFSQVVLGEGDIPYARIIRNLAEAGYEGWFTAERVYHPRKPEEDLSLQRNTLADIASLHRLLREAYT
ncbi:MAG: Sugar phosphate isomerase/epimerase [Pseudarthrobacter sp.]|nr:Sugar phosphate isomerase/epimerase [Pseudarthrobacter sp.]